MIAFQTGELLIVPYGIETRITLIGSNTLRLLIVPYGIETAIRCVNEVLKYF